MFKSPVSVQTHKRRRFVPGELVSVELDRCGHRARFKTPGSGLVPVRAKCPTCGRWRWTKESTAQKPRRRVVRTVKETRTEERDGQAFTVTVYDTPVRARFKPRIHPFGTNT